MENVYWVAGIVWVACHIVITIKAFQDEIVEGLLVLIVPFYLLYYMIRKMTMAGRGAFLFIYVVAAGLSVWGNIRPVGNELAKIVTPEDAETVLGEPVSAAQIPSAEDVPAGWRACLYQGKQTPKKKLLVLLKEPCTEVAKIKERMIPISSLGDVADEAYTGQHKFLARKGNRCFYLVTGGFEDSMTTSVNRQMLTRKALAELPPQ